MADVKVPYLLQRTGRPRWEPGPALRERGFKGRDLKRDDGSWMSEGEAIEAARAINKAIDDGAAAAVALPPATRSVNALCDLYVKSPNYLRRADTTRDGYDGHIRLIREWAGDSAVASITRANIANWHAMLEETRGPAMANAAYRVLKLLLYFAQDDLEWVDKVRARGVEMAQTEGRLVLWSFEEIAAYVRACQALGRPDVADAVLLAVMTGQRLGDVLALAPGDLRDGIYVIETGKTGRLAKVPAVTQLVARVRAMRARFAASFPGRVQATEVIDQDTGRPFDTDKFEKLFRAIRFCAAGVPERAIIQRHKSVPHLATLHTNLPPCAALIEGKGRRFADLRDTAVTWLCLAGCTKPEIATITGHSLKTIDAILDRHYFVRDDAFAHAARDKLQAYLDSKKVSFG